VREEYSPIPEKGVERDIFVVKGGGVAAVERGEVESGM
jgi:hypothetical protein